MAAQTEPEIILYDLACTKNICFSPTAWRIRLMLNYKQIPYKTVFLEFPDIEPTLKGLSHIVKQDPDLKFPSGVGPNESAPESMPKYTIPTIHHVPTNTYVMDSPVVAQFLESTYPDRPVPLTSELGDEIQAQTRVVGAAAFRASVMPRELRILSPRSQEYFRRSREARLGHPLEDLLDPEKEERVWGAIDDGLRAVGELMRTNKADGPFVLGARPSGADFFVAGTLQSARVVDEGVFQRNVKYPGFKDIYEACIPYMEKKD